MIGALPLAPTRWSEAARLLDDWIAERDFRGWDPYDALASPVVRALSLGTRAGAVAWTQLLRRSPVQLRPLLAVPRLENPKTLALVLEARLRLCPHAAEPPLSRLGAVQDRSGGWGYPFAWANRDALVPAGTPNAVATAFAGGALLEAEQAGLAVREPALVSAGIFVCEGLQRIPVGPAGFCFSYTPLDRRAVHNASVLAAALLARLSRRLARPEWAHAARAALDCTVAAQRPDGSWPYGIGARNAWVDGFHTGYVLIGLDEAGRALGTDAYQEPVQRGLEYWVRTFLVPPAVAHRPSRPYPVDMHAVAHAILTLLHFRDRLPAADARARALGDWAITHMRAADGSFHYLRYRRRTNRLPYLRWVQAWMLRALAQLAVVERGS